MIYLLSTFFFVIVLAIYQAVRAVLVLISIPRVKPILTIALRHQEEVARVREHVINSELGNQYHILAYTDYRRQYMKIKVHNANLTHSDLEKVKNDLLKLLSK